MTENLIYRNLSHMYNMSFTFYMAFYIPHYCCCLFAATAKFILISVQIVWVSVQLSFHENRNISIVSKSAQCWCVLSRVLLVARQSKLFLCISGLGLEVISACWRGHGCYHRVPPDQQIGPSWRLLQEQT